MDNYVSKPVRVDELAGVLSQCWALDTSVMTPLDRPFELPSSGAPTVTLDLETLNGLRLLAAQGEPDVVVELIDIFLADTPRLIESIRAAVDSADATSLHLAAHTLKSSSASLGALRLSRLSADQEALGRAGNLDSAAKKLALIEAEYEQVENALQTERYRV
jgi:HPt (histidine-containing phosphotransfer) domain-containing protein